MEGDFLSTFLQPRIPKTVNKRQRPIERNLLRLEIDLLSVKIVRGYLNLNIACCNRLSKCMDYPNECARLGGI